MLTHIKDIYRYKSYDVMPMQYISQLINIFEGKR